ncbi:hypothetical protein LVD17_10885 [Fulvivirga ulvae]|uniref:hypothetical protein n=1 Tax=Fulvivirga ulvae TaxID=2904245 RepID=UPI001F4633E2|nr:hypothetical protein [Fulvivirga ulvae]UII34313.1 hypothetical protein LVD17_10885 [Fulvivirga ulvae]
MSSHHFVREDQEPAVFIIDPVKEDILLQLLEWSPKVIVVQEAVELIISLGIKIDAVLCTKELRDNFRNILGFQMPVEIISVEEDNPDWIRQGISFLAEQDCKAVHIIGEVPEALRNWLAETALPTIVIWDTDYKWICCHTGQFSKWVTKGSTFILAEKEHAIIHTDSHIRQHKKQDILVINLLTEGMITFSVDHPFWLGEHID